MNDSPTLDRQRINGTTAVIYARVSSKEQEREGYSIPAQLKLLHDYANAKSLKVIREFIDVETAKAAGRSQFGEMIAFLRNQKAVQQILVEKTDRLYRNFKDYVSLDDLGVLIHLVKENDVLGKDSRSHSKLIHGLQVLLAKNFLDNLSEEVKKGHLEKARQGEYPAKAPLGYVNNTETHLVEVDTQKVHFVVRMFELASLGHYSLPQIRSQILQEGLGNYSPRVRLSKSHVKRILENPFYTGSFLWNGILYKGKHASVISCDLFNRAQNALRQRQKPKYRKHSFAYGGFLFCGRCGCMVTAEIKKSRYVYYHCTQSGNTCDELYYREEELAPQFDSIVKSIAIDPSVRDWLVRTIQAKHKDETIARGTTLEQLRMGLNKIQNRLDQLYIDKLDGKVSESFWMEKSKQWEAEKEQFAMQIAVSQVPNNEIYQDGFKLLELASRAYPLYSKQSAEQKNRFLRILLSNCTLQAGTLRPIYKKPFDILAKGVEKENWGE